MRHDGEVRDVCVIGLGLIGGSLLRAATAAGRTAWGTAASEAHSDAARADGYDVTTDLETALGRAERTDALVVLAVPLTELDEVLRRVGARAPKCLLTDVTSVKAPVLDSVRAMAPNARFVGGHPMAGTAESGWTAGGAALFAGAPWVACVEQDTDLEAFAEVTQLAIEQGAHVVPLAATTHDATVARVSHLPHLFAAVLAAVGVVGGPLAAALAAGSFRDATRVADTQPELVRAMTEGNRAALLEVVDEALGKLGAARGSLASTGGLAATVNAGYEGAQAFAALQEAPRASVSVDLAAADAKAGLCALGEQGGRLTAIDGASAKGEVPAPTN